MNMKKQKKTYIAPYNKVIEIAPCSIAVGSEFLSIEEEGDPSAKAGFLDFDDEGAWDF